MPMPNDIHRLVSLTFDEDPRVRKQAAEELGKLNDPAALFALIELSYDKDGGVKRTAQELLKQKKQQEEEVMSFADLFAAGKKFPEPKGSKENAEKRKEKILSPITQLFEKHLGKERAEAVRTKMMPTIDRMYSKITERQPREAGGERKVMQEFLTSYLEAIESIGSDEGHELEVHEELPEPALHEELEEIGTPKRTGRIEREALPVAEEMVEEPEETLHMPEGPDSVFRKAYEIMMLSGGDEKVMRREMKRMLRDLERDVHLAFHLAHKQFKETKITQLTKIRDGMRNVNTDILGVKIREHIEYPKGKEKKLLTRLVVSDPEGGEGVVYLFDDRGAWIQEGMQVRMNRAHVKTFDFSSETALAIGKKGSIYIVV